MEVENKEAKAEPIKEGESTEPTYPPQPFSRLFSFATPLDTFLILVGVVASAAAGTSMPLLIVILGNSIDTFNANDMDKLYDEVCRLATLMTVIGVVAFAVHCCGRVCWVYSSERQMEAMRVAYMKGILRQEMAYFDSMGTGRLTTQVITNTQKMQDAIGEKLGQLIQYLSTFVTGIIVGFVFDWKLTLVVLSMLPLKIRVAVQYLAAFLLFCFQNVIVGGIIFMFFAKAEESTQKAYAGAGNIATETISAIRTVQSFNLLELALEKYTLEISNAMKVGIKKGFFSGASIGAIYFVWFGSYSLTFWYGGKLYQEGEVTGGDVLVVVMTVMIASFMLGMASSNVEILVSGKAASGGFFAVLNRVPTIDNASQEGLKMNSIEGALQLTNVHFRYPSRPTFKILQGVSLTIPAGAKIALVGPSGSGKSSIIQLLQRFYDPEEGSISLDGHDMKGLNVGWLRYQFGIVGQEPALFSGTIRENIAFGCHEAVSQEQIETAARAALAHDFIRSFPQAYDTQVGERGAQLSGGQKQRIAIARAILKNPKILLLDEATSALDSKSEKKVQRALDNAAQGRTTIIVAHRLSTIRNADIIAVISKGEIVEIGTHKDLLAMNGVYGNLVRIQLGAHTELGPTESIAAKKDEEADENKIEVVVKQEEEMKKKVKVYFSWRQLYQMSKSESPQLFLGMLGSAAVGVINPLQAIFFAKIFSAYYLDPKDVIDNLRPWLITYVGLAIGMQVSYTLQGYFFGYAGQKLVYRCRYESFKSILRQEIGWFDQKENATGILTGKLSSEAMQVEGAVGTPLGAYVTCFAAVITGFTIAYINGWKLAWVLTLSFPAVLLGGLIEIYAMHATDNMKQEILLAANVIATETISNIRTVASYANESKMLEKYSTELLKPKEKSVQFAGILGLLTGFGQFAVMGFNALAFWYGGKLIRDGDMNFAEFLTIYQAFVFTSESVSMTLGFSSNITKARGAAIKIFALINRMSQIDALSETGTKANPKTVRGEITFEGVRFAYPTRPDMEVLSGLDLVIKPNRVTALVGASGCGKSSCIALIQRWYEPIQGQIKLDGTDLSGYNIPWLRKLVGLVGQEPVLFSGTIAENIGCAVNNATREEIEEAAKSANAHTFITSFPDGYKTQVGEKGVQLSGGQKQRIAIARAIIKKPTILLLDEATSALDTESEEIVQQALDNVMEGLTTVVIAHRLSTIKRAHHIAVIDQGIVVEQGTHEELINSNGHYFRLVEAQTS